MAEPSVAVVEQALLFPTAAPSDWDSKPLVLDDVEKTAKLFRPEGLGFTGQPLGFAFQFGVVSELAFQCLSLLDQEKSTFNQLSELVYLSTKDTIRGSLADAGRFLQAIDSRLRSHIQHIVLHFFRMIYDVILSGETPRVHQTFQALVLLAKLKPDRRDVRIPITLSEHVPVFYPDPPFTPAIPDPNRLFSTEAITAEAIKAIETEAKTVTKELITKRFAAKLNEILKKKQTLVGLIPDIKELNRLLKEHEQAKKKLEADLSSVNAAMDLLQKEITENVEKGRTAEEKFNNLLKQKAELEKKNKEAETKLATQDQQLADLNAELATRNLANNALHQQIEQLQKQNNQAALDLATKNQQIEQLQKQNNQAAIDLATKNQQLTDAANKVVNLNAELATANQTNVTLQENLTAANRIATTLTNQVNQANAERKRFVYNIFLHLLQSIGEPNKDDQDSLMGWATESNKSYKDLEANTNTFRQLLAKRLLADVAAKCQANVSEELFNCLSTTPGFFSGVESPKLPEKPSPPVAAKPSVKRPLLLTEAEAKTKDDDEAAKKARPTPVAPPVQPLLPQWKQKLLNPSASNPFTATVEQSLNERLAALLASEVVNTSSLKRDISPSKPVEPSSEPGRQPGQPTKKRGISKSSKN